MLLILLLYFAVQIPYRSFVNDCSGASMLNHGDGSTLQNAWGKRGPQPSPKTMEQEAGHKNVPPPNIKRKHLDVGDLDSSNIKQGKEETNQENQPGSRGQPVDLTINENSEKDDHAACTATTMPEKHTLELILDVLQRRDTYEIFAEPVDPQKVGDYYEIIKEPMDFGTMRAKLHEGMYGTLEQFEVDIFLISGNAMRYNSSGSIYYRQARAIDELAKKVFDVLKTDPGNFELEFSGTRRRSGRRPQAETKDYSFSSSTRVGTNFRAAGVTNDVSSKEKQCHTSTSRRKLRGVSVIGSRCANRDHYALFPGAQDGTKYNTVEVDRRSTYNPGVLSPNENESILAQLYSDPKLLLVNQSDISYSKSLMLFVKDLGPTAQMVAREKLKRPSTRSDAPAQNKFCNVRDSARRGWETKITSNSVSGQNVVDLVLKPRIDRTEDPCTETDRDREETGNSNVGRVTRDKVCGLDLNERSYKDDLHGQDKAKKKQRTKIHESSQRGALSPESETDASTIIRLNNTTNSNINHRKLIVSDKLNDNERTISRPTIKSTPTWSTQRPPSRDIDSWTSRSDSKEKMNTKGETSSSPWILGFSSFSKMESVDNRSKSSRLGSKYQGTSTSPADEDHQRRDRREVVTFSSSKQQVMSSEASQYPLETSASGSSSRFTFDIPFLKSQLTQMKVMGRQQQQQQQQDRRKLGGMLFQQRSSVSAAHKDEGKSFDPKGYIKVPVHFAEQPSLLSASAAHSSFLSHKQQHAPSVVDISSTTNFLPPPPLPPAAASDPELSLQL